MTVSQNDLSFRRVVNTPKRNVGRRRMGFLEKYAAENERTLYNALKRNLDDDIFKGTKAAHFLAHVALFTNADADSDSDKVKLMTVHAAKGL